MSEQGGGTAGGPPGPGWWQASDGNWYPPESTPGAAPTPPPTPPAPGAAPGGPPPGIGGPPPAPGLGGPPPGFGGPPLGGPAVPPPGEAKGNGVKVIAIIGAVLVGLVGLSVLAIVAITFLGEDEPARDETGAIEEEGDLGVFSLRIGDCFDDVPEAFGGGEVESVPAVPCDQPHDNEVFAKPELGSGSYPGEAELDERALTACIDAFPGYTGESYDTSELYVFPITPTEDAWEQGDIRYALCALYDGDLSKLTGSQKAG